jgi:hypothetical protein
MGREWWTAETGVSLVEGVSVGTAVGEIAGAPRRRRIDEVIVHHTWEPRVAAYKGRATWAAIQQYHMRERGWSDIGYHIGISPHPLEPVWLLRPLACPGGHTLGHNANSIGIVLLGNYDKGKDDLSAVWSDACKVVAALCERYDLELEHVRFHREFADKSCPGTGVDLKTFRESVGRAIAGVAIGGPAPVTTVGAERKWGFTARRDGEDLVAEGYATTWSDHTTQTGIPADTPGLVACSLPRGLCDKTIGSPFVGVPDLALVKVWYGKTNRVIYAPVIDEGPAYEAQAGTGKPGMAMIDLTPTAKRLLGFAGPEVNDKVSVRVMAGQVWRPGMVLDAARLNVELGV